jgi:NADPH2:quinone reductase
MSPSIPKSMKAVVIEKFGGPEVFHTATVPVPDIGEKDVLVQVDTAGIGEWDPWLAEGGMGGPGGFPMVIGSDGSGTVVGVGHQVKRFRVGDQVYGYSYDNPKGGFYAEYASIPEDCAAKIPANVGMNEAGAMPASGITALLGLEEIGLKKGQNVAILGASGGVGHVAVQLAKLMGARVLAVASGDDGVSLVRRLGADVAIDGHKNDIASVAKSFDPNGLNAVLAFAYSPEMKDVLGQVKNGGHVAYPNGVEPEPRGGKGVKTSSYDGLPGREIFARLNRLVESGPFQLEISRTYSMDEIEAAMQDVLKHHVGKLALRIE